MKGEGKFFQNLDKLYNFGYVNLLKSSAVIFNSVTQFSEHKKISCVTSAIQSTNAYL